MVTRLRQRVGASAGAGQTRSVFFNRIWIGGAAITLLIGIGSGQQALALLALLVLITAGLAAGWNRVCLSGVVYRRTLSATRAFPGDTLTMTLSVVNRKPLPVTWLGIDDEISEALHLLDRETTLAAAPGRRMLRLLTSVRPYERVNWQVALRCDERGVHWFGPATLRAGDPFGFFTNRLTVRESEAVIVYPRVRPLQDLGFPPRQPFGETRVVRHLFADPTRVVGVRDYRPEDSFRAIHWKATARQRRLQVRVSEPTTALQLGIFINLDTFDHYWEGLDIVQAERAIELAASIAVWSDGQRLATGVYANGLLSGSDQPLRLPPGRGPGQLPRILEGLAKLSAYSTVAFLRLLRVEAARLPWGSTIVLISGMLPEALTAQMARLLADGHRVVFVPLGVCPEPRLRGLVVRRVDDTFGEVDPAAIPIPVAADLGLEVAQKAPGLSRGPGIEIPGSSSKVG